MPFFTPKILIVAATLTVAAGGAVAIAAWSTSGSGSAYAKAATASAITLSDASASAGADLYPGVTAAAYVKVTNPNTFPIQVTAVSATGAVTSNAGAACTSSSGVTFNDRTGLSLAVAAGATSVLTLTGAVSMSNTSHDTCQGAVFTIPVTVTAASS